MLLHLSGLRSKFRAPLFYCHRLGQIQERDTKLVKLAKVVQALHRNNELAINTKLVTRTCKYSSKGSSFFYENQTMPHWV